MAANDLAGPMSRLVDELKLLPGLGRASAQRIAFHLLGVERERAARLARAIVAMREEIRLCVRCHNLSESDLCSICRDRRRDHAQICVVEQPNNVLAIERTRRYTGVYHVLHGTLDTVRGIGPDNIKLKSLLERMKEHPTREIIVATSPTSEGNGTAVYISRILERVDVKLTRIATGVPLGSDLQHVDPLTMSEALTGRRQF